MHSAKTKANRRHVLYKMTGKKKSPIGGDTKSWFRHYKWETSGAVFVPVRPPFVDGWPGDLVWFCMDQYVVGCAQLLRVIEDPLNRIQELWYCADDVWVLDKPKKISKKWGTKVPPRQAERWLKECSQRVVEEDPAPLDVAEKVSIFTSSAEIMTELLSSPFKALRRTVN